jgi:hypothetical protein
LPKALKEAVTPLGSAEADSATFPVNPFVAVMEIALVPVAPSTTLRLPGASVRAKSGAGVTVTVIVRVAVRLPEVPLSVNCDALGAVELAAVRVSVLVAFVLAGLNDAVTPAGKPAAVKATVPPKLPCGATLMVAVPALPAATFTLATEEASVKLGAATVKARAAFAEMLPDVAVMVTVAVPIDAEALAVSVSVLVELMLAGLNVAVTPVGNPPIARLAAPVKPFSGVTVMVLLPDVPCVMLRLAGAAPNLKLGAAATVKARVAFAEMLPDVAVMVTVAVPIDAEALAASVSVLVELMLAGLNVAVTPVGNPAVARLAAPVKPFSGVTVMVLVPDVPCVTLRLAGAAPNVKLGAAATVKPRLPSLKRCRTSP